MSDVVFLNGYVLLIVVVVVRVFVGLLLVCLVVVDLLVVLLSVVIVLLSFHVGHEFFLSRLSSMLIMDSSSSMLSLISLFSINVVV